jgi:hypothetical protein
LRFLEAIVNTETGQVYRGDAAISAARARGEPVVRVSERVAEAVEAGMNRAARRNRRFSRRLGSNTLARRETHRHGKRL